MSTNLIQDTQSGPKEDKDYYVAKMKLLDTQYMEMMQKAREFNQHKKTKYENSMNKQESQHAKEIEQIWKVYADRAKVHEEDCKKKTTKIPTSQEKQQENHQTMMKTPENNKEETMNAKEHKVDLTRHNKKSVEAVDALVTIRERSMTFEDLQVNVRSLKDTHKNNKQVKVQKPTTKNEMTNKMQEKYKKDEERKPKIPSKTVQYNPLTNNAWNKNHHRKGNCADPLQFNPQYKKRKKSGRKDRTIAVPQQKKKNNIDPLIHNAWSKKRKHKRKGAVNWLFC